MVGEQVYKVKVWWKGYRILQNGKFQCQVLKSLKLMIAMVIRYASRNM